MGEWLVLLVVVLTVPVLLMGGAVALAASSLRRANRLMPGRAAGSIPVTWLWSPGTAAALHRRLRYVCQLSAPLAGPPAGGRRLRRRRGGGLDGISRLAGEVLAEAVALDRELVATNYLPRGLPRAQALAEMEAQVRSLESSARRVQQLSARRTQLARPGGPADLTLDQRIAAMEDALNELGPEPGSLTRPPLQ